MKKNVGGIDRIARLVIGPILILAGVAGYAGLLVLAVGPLPQTLTAVIVFVVGTILLVTGLSQTCPMNRLLGVNTNREKGTR
ncbi:YgaP family membrane protein [Halobacteriaceae archaeon SHR40]|uniref:YgaP family membrane protein n=1 Tax=Halovenus amylolytica TaxID=2500550 RepID=UPI000FE2FD06